MPTPDGPHEYRDANELYEALDWLLERRNRIENELAMRQLENGAAVLFDASSSPYHGQTRPLALFGSTAERFKESW